MPMMRPRGIVLAGGTGRRLLPLTATVNKHLLPIGPRAMIDTPIDRLLEAGIDEIAVVSDPRHLDALAAHLAPRPARLTFLGQARPAGIADALGVAREFAANEPVVVVLGDNLWDDPLGPHIAAWQASGLPAQVHLAEVADPERFGVARFEGDRLVELVEKPAVPPSRLAVTGIYCYAPGVFDRIARLAPSPRGELEITDLNAGYLAEGALAHRFLAGAWRDVGTPDAYVAAHRAAST